MGNLCDSFGAATKYRRATGRRNVEIELGFPPVIWRGGGAHC